MITQYGLDPAVAVVLTFALALVLGAVNGWLVVRTRLPSFLITLASMLVLRGVTIAMTREITNQTIVRLPPGAADSPALRLFSAPLFTIDRAVFRVELLWWLAVVVVGSWVLLRTRFGNWIFAVGGSALASRYVGVPVSRVKITLFMTTAAAAALYSCIVVPQVGSANVNDGTGKEFQAIITAVVGGTLLTGGYGSVIGSAFGAFILGATALGILYAGINTDWYNAVLGLLLLVGGARQHLRPAPRLGDPLMDQPPFTAHDDAPLTLPQDTAAKIAAYGMHGAHADVQRRPRARGTRGVQGLRSGHRPRHGLPVGPRG